MGEAERNIERAFRLMREVAKEPGRFPPRFIAIPLDPALVGTIFTPERIRLLKELRDRGPVESMGSLAGRVHRDQTRVSRDVQFLADAGLVVTERHGKSKRVRATERPIVIA